jgi:GAG-pre-integrase domain
MSGLLQPAQCLGILLGPLSGLPSDNNGPEPHGCGTTAEGGPTILSSPQDTVAISGLATSPPDPHLSIDPLPPPLLHRESPTFGMNIPLGAESEEENDTPADYLVRSLSRPALRMLWHQRLGRINFRRLSTMHRFVKGMPEFTIPNALEECPVCLAAKLRKQPSSTVSTMKSTVCNQGTSIDFGFMVQWSSD